MASLFKTNSKIYEEDDYHLDLGFANIIELPNLVFCIINEVGVGLEMYLLGP